MMTALEQRFYESMISMANKSNKSKSRNEIRLEIATRLLCNILDMTDNSGFHIYNDSEAIEKSLKLAEQLITENNLIDNK